MKLTAAMVKEAAFAAGAGDIGIGNIERWANAPRLMHPKNIFPDCRSVITIVQPITRHLPGHHRGHALGQLHLLRLQQAEHPLPAHRHLRDRLLH